MLTGRKLPLTLAFVVLIGLAVGAGCRGFFVKPTLTSITINPTGPSVQENSTATLQAYGVYNDGSGGYLTSGVSWSSSDISVATVTGNGSATLSGVSIGTATITAAAESVTNTTTATVYIIVSSMSISPSSQSIAPSATTPAPFIVEANGSTDISSGATLNVYQSGTLQTTITCAYDAAGSAGAGQYCTSVAATAGKYQVVATYPGTTITATAELDIT